MITKRLTLRSISLLLALTGLEPWQPKTLAGTAGIVYRMDLTSCPDGLADEAALPGAKLNATLCRIQDHWLTVKSGNNNNPRVDLPARLDGDGTFRATVRDAARCDRVMIEGWGVYTLGVSRQFGQLILSRTTGGTARQVAASGPLHYLQYVRRWNRFELRLVRSGHKVAGFIDDCKLVEFDDSADVPAGGQFALLGGWGTDVGWRNVSVSSQPDLTEWPHETFPAIAPSDLVRVNSVRGMNDDNLYFDGQSAGLTVKVVSPRRAKVNLTYRLIDVWQKEVGKKLQTIDLADGKERELEVRFTPAQRGCFKVAMYVDFQPREPGLAPQNGWVEDLGGFTVISKAVGERPANPDSVFGGHIEGGNFDWHAKSAWKLGVRWVRCHDFLQHTWWAVIQPKSATEWTWRDRDQIKVDEYGYTTLGTFMWTPRWASTQPDQLDFKAYPPRDPKDLANYVATVVGRYRSSIHVWEVWNEPHVHDFWAGSAVDYARLLEVAYAAAKKADPNCTVLGGGGVSVESMQWIERFIASLRDKSMDAFSVHYIYPESAATDLGYLRKLLVDRGVDVPIWNTEASVMTTSFLDQCRSSVALPEARFHFRNACYELVRMYMENLANGVKRVFYYYLSDPWRSSAQLAKPQPPNRQLGTGMWDQGRMLKPIAAAHAALVDVIEGKAFVKRIAAGPVQVFLFASKEEAAVVCYAEFDTFGRQERVPLTPPPGLDLANLTMLDFMDNKLPLSARDNSFMLTVSREPVYFRLRMPGPDNAPKLEAMFKTVRVRD